MTKAEFEEPEVEVEREISPTVLCGGAYRAYAMFRGQVLESADRRTTFVLSVHGVGGTGKSEFVRECRRFCDLWSIRYAMADLTTREEGGYFFSGEGDNRDVIFIDGYDVNPNLDKLLWNGMFLPHVMKGGILVRTGSRPASTGISTLRLAEYKLGNLDEGDTRWQLEGILGTCSSETFELVYGITGGHPMGNKVAAEVLRRDPSVDRRALVREVYQEVVEGRILAGVDADLRKKLRDLSLLRAIDGGLLDRIYSEGGGQALLLRMKDTGLLVQEGAFRVRPELSVMATEYLREWLPRNLVEVHEEAAGYYEDLLKSGEVDNTAFLLAQWLDSAMKLNVLLGGDTDGLISRYKELAGHVVKGGGGMDVLEDVIDDVEARLGEDVARSLRDAIRESST